MVKKVFPFIAVLLISIFTLSCLFAQTSSLLVEQTSELQWRIKETFVPLTKNQIIPYSQKQQIDTLFSDIFFHLQSLDSLADNPNLTDEKEKIHQIKRELEFAFALRSFSDDAYQIHLTSRVNQQRYKRYKSFTMKLLRDSRKASFWDFEKFFETEREPKNSAFYSTYMAKKIRGIYVEVLYNNVLDFEKRLFYPVKNMVVLAFGRVRLSDRKWGLITKQQTDTIAAQLRVGDLLIERKNWVFSNIALPGFWGHSAIYVGTPELLAKWAEDDAIKGYYQSRGYRGFVDFLKTNYAQAFLEYSLVVDSKKMAILEALAAGVRFFSADGSIGISDGVAAFRPKISKLDIAKALEIAFSFYGRGYDSDFDFVCDERLICTELLYKSFQSDKSKAGVDFELSHISGRTTLSANEIVKQFAKDSINHQVDFVLFYDGIDKKRISVKKSEEFFKTTPLRPNWRYSDSLVYKKQTKTKKLKTYRTIPLSFSLLLDSEIDKGLRKGSKSINILTLGFPNSAYDLLTGADVSFLGAFARESALGLQVAGFTTYAKKSLFGVQLSGAKSRVGRSAFGITIAGFDNFVAGQMFGVQLSGLSNITTQLKGVQASPTNSSIENNGIQIGIFNQTIRNGGLQIGFINKAKKGSGYSLGALNLGGEFLLDIAIKNFKEPNATLLSGRNSLLSGVGVSLKNEENSANFKTGYRLFGEKLWVYLTHKQLLAKSYSNTQISARVYPLGGKLFVEPTFSLYQNSFGINLGTTIDFTR